MKSRELLKINDYQSIVEIMKDRGRTEYCVCSYYTENAKEGSKWSWGHYFVSLEGAIKYAATKCFEPIVKYILLETDSDGDKRDFFDSYSECIEEYTKRKDKYMNDECFSDMRCQGRVGHEICKLCFDEDTPYEESVTLQIIEVVV